MTPLRTWRHYWRSHRTGRAGHLCLLKKKNCQCMSKLCSVSTTESPRGRSSLPSAPAPSVWNTKEKRMWREWCDLQAVHIGEWMELWPILLLLPLGGTPVELLANQ